MAAGLLLSGCGIVPEPTKVEPTPTAITATPRPPDTAVLPTQTAEPPDALAQPLPDPPTRDAADIARRLLGVEVDSALPAQQTWVVGQRDTFNVTTDGGFPTVEAELVYMSGLVHAWVQTGALYNAGQLRAQVDRFAQEIVPSVTDVFGGVEPMPLHILHTQQPTAGYAGYYTSRNEWSQEAVPTTNERAMFVMNLAFAPPGTPMYLTTLTHELQHLVHWRADRNEDTWINEGLSETARIVSGLSGSPAADSYLANPTIQLTTWPDSGTTPHYGGGYLLGTYLLDRFGEDGIRILVAHPENGMAGIQGMLDVLGTGLDADTVFMEWAVATLASDPSFVEFQPGASVALNQYGLHYVEVDGPVAFDGSDQVTIVPVDLDGTAWWSNRGDDMDSMLTYAFDLTGVAEATLKYDVWFAIEEGWDYAYVQISTDGGASWDLLETPYTTRANPNGLAYGPGYSGYSTNISRDGWLAESLDLTPYAGGEVLVRFEMLTDDAVNEPGLLLDNLSVPEIDFADDVETDTGLWEAAGFARIDNVLPQTFAVWAVLPEGDVVPLALDEGNRAELMHSSAAVLIITGLTRDTTQPATYTLTLR
ncbi:MAG: hypothetical protein ACFB51_21175 [Anaerolineae bacterium]